MRDQLACRLFGIIGPRLPCRVTNMQDFDSIASEPVENLVWIAQYQHGANAGPINNARCAARATRYAIDDLLDPF